jgi:polyprenyldihydroxybenzoate methyltransferase / 3-demethylubiquinol 3-O-methyltransferase
MKSSQGSSSISDFISFFSTKPAAVVENNVNYTDVEHHSKLAEDWWDPSGPLKGLHAMNSLRVPLVRDGLVSTGVIDEANVNKGNVLQGINILEVGCGAGILTKALGNLKANVTALDPSEKLLATAKQQISTDTVQFVCDTIENHSQNNKEKYDAVVASEVLEHVVDQKSFLTACVESLKPGGSIFITTFNKTQLSWLAGIVAAEYVLNLVPRHTHDWNLFISPQEVEKLLKELNCSTVLIHGIRYEFWRNTCVWQSNTSVNYALHAVKNES